VLRSAIGAAATIALVCVAPVAGSLAPASATSTDQAGDHDIHPEWGSTQGESGVLKRGCREYHYSYAINPPEGDWGLEIFISGPGFNHLAAGAFDGGYDPTAGRGTYKLCKVTTHYGTFTIEAKLSADNGPEGYVEGWLPPSQFRLHRRHR
jgi:hypothetical protein